MLPFSKRTYSFRGGEIAESKADGSTPLRKIKSRGRTFIGSKTPTNENTQEEAGFVLTPFTRGSVRLKSIRKRKMANRDDVKNDAASVKRGKMANKEKDEIEVKIEDNIRMRDGIMKLLSDCHDTRQAMDIGRNLLTINSRVLSLMSSLQKKRSSNILKDYNKNQSGSDLSKNLEPCLGDVAVSDIRIPLMWKQDAHFKTKAGEQPALLYHMFCLLKINDQVFDTPLFQFSQIDTDVTFNDVFTFRNVPADFKLELEAYYSVMQNPDNPAWTPMRTPKKSVYSSAPKYCLAAHAQLTVNDVKDGFVVSDFTMGGIGASATAVLGHVDDFPDNPLALWGQFSCQIRARPSIFLNEKLEGHLLVQTANGGQPVWEKYYCRVRNCTIQGWKHFPDKEEGFSMKPGISVKLKKGMKLRLENSRESLNPHLLILTTKTTDEKEPVFGFEEKEELMKWEAGLQQALVDARAWKNACYTSVNIEEFEAKKKAFSKAMSSYDHNAINSDIRPSSPVLVRKSVKTSSKVSLSLHEITPKVKSFYDQINIIEKSDSTDSALIAKEETQSNESADRISINSNSNASSTTDSERVDANIGAVSAETDTRKGGDDEPREEIETNEHDDTCKSSEVIVSNGEINYEALDNDDEKEEVEAEDEVADASENVAADDRTDEVMPDADEPDVDENTAGQNSQRTTEITTKMQASTNNDVGLIETSEGNMEIDVSAANQETELFGENQGLETEESVLDYLVETIDSAAHLDESTDSCLDSEDMPNSQQEVVTEKETDVQLDIVSEVVTEKEADVQLDIVSEVVTEKEADVQLDIVSEVVTEKEADVQLDIVSEVVTEKEADVQLDIVSEVVTEKEADVQLDIVSEVVTEKEADDQLDIVSEEEVAIKKEVVDEKDSAEELVNEKEALVENESIGLNVKIDEKLESDQIEFLSEEIDSKEIIDSLDDRSREETTEVSVENQAEDTDKDEISLTSEKVSEEGSNPIEADSTTELDDSKVTGDTSNVNGDQHDKVTEGSANCNLDVSENQENGQFLENYVNENVEYSEFQVSKDSEIVAEGGQNCNVGEISEGNETNNISKNVTAVESSSSATDSSTITDKIETDV